MKVDQLRRALAKSPGQLRVEADSGVLPRLIHDMVESAIGLDPDVRKWLLSRLFPVLDEADPLLIAGLIAGAFALGAKLTGGG